MPNSEAKLSGGLPAMFVSSNWGLVLVQGVIQSPRNPLPFITLAIIRHPHRHTQNMEAYFPDHPEQGCEHCSLLRRNSGILGPCKLVQVRADLSQLNIHTAIDFRCWARRKLSAQSGMRNHCAGLMPIACARCSSLPFRMHSPGHQWFGFGHPQDRAEGARLFPYFFWRLIFLPCEPRELRPRRASV